MLGEFRTGVDFLQGSLEKDSAVSDRDFLYLLLVTFEESRMIGAAPLQRLELFGGNTCRTQVADRGSRRTGESRKLSNRREVGQLASHRRFISGPNGQCLRTDCRAGGDSRRRQLYDGQPGRELHEAEAMQSEGSLGRGGQPTDEIVHGIARSADDQEFCG